MKLLLDNVNKQYGNKYALKDLTIEFTNGVYGILGANGAGKTTLINIVTGILQQTSGQVKLDGRDIKEMGTEYLNKIGYLPQYPQFYPNFRVKEFLMYMCSIKDVPKKKVKEILPEIIEKVNLQEHVDTQITEYDDKLVRKYIDQIQIYDDKFVVCFKAKMEINVLR